MEAAAETPGPVANKSNVLPWIGGLVVVVVVAFLLLGRNVTNGYEADVKKRLKHPDQSVGFVGVKRYKSGVVCGMVKSLSGTQRFIVGVNRDVVLDDDSLVSTQVFTMTSDQLCRD